VAYAHCFENLEEIIASLNGSKRHGYRIRFRALQCELKAAVDELMLLEQQLVDIRRCLAQQAVAASHAVASASLPASAKVAGQHPVGSLEAAAEVRQV